jgi:hypothetical protein
MTGSRRNGTTYFHEPKSIAKIPPDDETTAFDAGRMFRDVRTERQCFSLAASVEH